MSVEERLKAFMTDFVSIYENWLTDLYGRLCNQESKTGKTAKRLLPKTGIRELDVLLNILTPVVDAFISRYNREEQKKLTDILYEFNEDPLEFRNVLLQSSAEIFRIYEDQFLCIVSSDSKSWRRAMSKMAHDAVFRAIDHHQKHRATEILFSDVTEGVISGSSKAFNTVLGHKGHSVDFGGRESYTSDVFERVGLKVDNTYYIRNEPSDSTMKKLVLQLVPHPKPSTFRFRLLFEGEKVNSNEYTELDKIPPDTYNYLLTTEMLESARKAVYDELMKRGNVGEYILKMMEEMQQEAKGDANDLLQRVDDCFSDMKDGLGVLQNTADNTAKSTSSRIETCIDLNKEDLDVGKRTLAIVEVVEEVVKGIDLKLDKGAGGSGTRERICFNVEPPVGLFTGRNEELGKVHEAIHRNTEGRPVSILSRITVVCGMGGVGKTQLLRRYIQDHREDYDDVLWLDAENEATLNGSFQRLAKDKLDLKTKDANGGDKEVQTIVEEVYGKFCGRKYLIIFDNVDVFDNVEMKYLKPYLPSSLTSPKPSILITSQYQEWDRGIEMVPLEVMDPSEAWEFVKEGLDIRDDSVDREIEALVEELHCFPLAIQQAIAYIAVERRTTSGFAINDYVDLLKKKTKELLDSPKAFPGLDNDYSKTTFTTWNVAIDKILKDEQYGQIALEILNVMAYLGPDDIKRDFFKGLAGGNEEKLKSAVHLLVKFSIVSGRDSESILSIHRLVQVVIRLRLDSQREYEVMMEAYKLFCFKYGIRSKVLGLFQEIITKNKPFNDFSGFTVMIGMEEHFESLLEHLEEKIDDKPVVGDGNLGGICEIIEEILDHLTYITFYSSEPSKINNFYMKLLQKRVAIKEKLYGPDDSRVAVAKDDLDCYRSTTETSHSFGAVFWGSRNYLSPSINQIPVRTIVCGEFLPEKGDIISHLQRLEIRTFPNLFYSLMH